MRKQRLLIVTVMIKRLSLNSIRFSLEGSSIKCFLLNSLEQGRHPATVLCRSSEVMGGFLSLCPLGALILFQGVIY